MDISSTLQLFLNINLYVYIQTRIFMCIYIYSLTVFHLLLFFFFFSFLTPWWITLGTPARKEVNTEGKDVTEIAQREEKYLSKKMIESMTGTTSSLLEINMNEMLCFID